MSAVGPHARRPALHPVIALLPDSGYSLSESIRGVKKMELAAADAKPSGPPWLTFVLLAAIIGVFACEIAFGLDPPADLLQPSVRTLAAMGASNWILVVTNGEWHRVISATFLHGSLLHLVLNGIVLLWAGSLLERVTGRAWYAAIYAVSGVAGSIASLAFNPPSVVSVGASGALMGVVASLFVVSFHFTPGPVRGHLQSVSLRVLIPSLLPIIPMGGGMRVDFGAHLGGALGGAVAGLILVALWPRREAVPRARGLAAAVGLAGLAAAVATAWKVDASFVKTQLETAAKPMLIPNSQLPRSDADMKAQVDSLAARYPYDPRPRLFRGSALIEAGEFAGAERELRASLAGAETFREVLPPQVERMVRTNLAIAVIGNKQTAEAKAEAKAIAEPVCRVESVDSRPLRTRLKRLNLCD
jgi:membrane associated rhomboid family serine protease